VKVTAKIRVLEVVKIHAQIAVPEYAVIRASADAVDRVRQADVLLIARVVVKEIVPEMCVAGDVQVVLADALLPVYGLRGVQGVLATVEDVVVVAVVTALLVQAVVVHMGIAAAAIVNNI
jgi:hypothetical protein